MSIRDLNKVIIMSSGLTGSIIMQIPFEDLNISHEYISLLVHKYIDNGEGILIKVGNKT